ncbi:hypothetical protein [Microbacterium sp. LWH10-1.2]|uniref:hypothetical protein n=1 Tax=Microbacterium sp. LWH10-1.2 TaxID=3135255 RepID=UPI00313A3F52
MKKSISLLAPFGIALLVASTLGAVPASANDQGPTNDASELTQEFSGVVEEMNLSNGVASQLLSKFDRLSVAEKANLVSVLEGDNPAAAFEVGAPVVTTTIRPTTETASNAAKTATAAAATYEVTSNYKNDNLLLGVAVGTWNLRYKYQTGSGKVLKDYECTNWYSGLSGFWNFSTSSTHRVAGGQGYCTGVFRGSLVYQGSGFTMNKEMGMIVNGPGFVSRWLKNI